VFAAGVYASGECDMTPEKIGEKRLRR